MKKLFVLLLSFLLLLSCTACAADNDTKAALSSIDSKAAVADEESSSYQTPSEPESKPQPKPEAPSPVGSDKAEPPSAASIPEYQGQIFIQLNDNVPSFSADELKAVGYEKYGELDSLGRVTVAVASLGSDTMPKQDEKRGDISKIKPTGWVQKKYDNISGKYLYNRCHLIGWQLSAENANRKNLITGTRYFNVEGMLTFENMVADYIKETDNHVAYRVTPVFEGDNLLCKGVQIEAYSIEDRGDGISFNIFCYNVQPDININYKTGDSTAVKKE